MTGDFKPLAASHPTASSGPHPTSDRLLPAPPLARRMACWLYEGVLLFGVVFIPAYLFSSLSQSRHGLEHRHAHQAFLFVVLGIYFTWFWSRGQTLALKTWRISVVDTKGARISQARALLRYLLAWLWFLPPLALAWLISAGPLTAVALLILWIPAWAASSVLRRDRQYWHDAWAGTRLVDTNGPSDRVTR